MPTWVATFSFGRLPNIWQRRSITEKIYICTTAILVLSSLAAGLYLLIRKKKSEEPKLTPAPEVQEALVDRVVRDVVLPNLFPGASIIFPPREKKKTH